MSTETRKKIPKDNGLEDASRDQINEESAEERRRKIAKEKGLPEDSSWDEINEVIAKEARKELSKKAD